MSIPSFQSLMLPLLKLAGDRKEHLFRDAVEEISNQFNLSDAERRETIPSGSYPLISNRVGWARTYLKKAGLLESNKRGYFHISKRGLDVLLKDPSEINVAFLRQFPEFLEFQKPKKKPSTEPESEQDDSETPEERIGIAFPTN